MSASGNLGTVLYLSWHILYHEPQFGCIAEHPNICWRLDAKQIVCHSLRYLLRFFGSSVVCLSCVRSRNCPLSRSALSLRPSLSPSSGPCCGLIPLLRRLQSTFQHTPYHRTGENVETMIAAFLRPVAPPRPTAASK